MANRAFLPAVLLWATLTPALYKFARYCDIRYGSAVRQMPLETAAAAPQAAVDPALYLAPALRCAPDAGWCNEAGSCKKTAAHAKRAGLTSGWWASHSGWCLPQHVCCACGVRQSLCVRCGTHACTGHLLGCQVCQPYLVPVLAVRHDVT